jgi:predicted nucleotidyltransferase
MTAVVEVPGAIRTFLDEVLAVLSDYELEGAYLIGSLALGAYDPARSDIDVYAVVADALGAGEKEQLATRVATLTPPARRLELVVYSRAEAASPDARFDFNFGDPDASDHWFVVDRAIAEQHAIPLSGPPWGDLFAPVPRERLLAALDEALAWFERHDPAGAAVAAARASAWLETGDWLAKPAAGAWLAARVREQLGAAR